MARIRTIKPEFWTDEVVVQLPFEARLLFIGIWNFADDHGGMQDSSERLRLQIFPGDPAIDVADLLDLLNAAGLVDRYCDDQGRYALQIKNWEKHQRVDNPGKARVIGDAYRKLAIPSEARRALAIKYGCVPGERKDVTCFFCGMPGHVHWHRLSNGRPSAWVTFPVMEIDHADPEASGGGNSLENLVLSCRACNRSRGKVDVLSYISRGFVASPIETTLDPIEGSSTSRGSLLGREGKGREKERIKEARGTEARSVAGLNLTAFDRWTTYRAERKPAIKPASMKAAAEELAALGTAEAQAAAVQHSIANGYQGLFPPKANGGLHVTTSPPLKLRTADEIEAEERARGQANAEH